MRRVLALALFVFVAHARADDTVLNGTCDHEPCWPSWPTYSCLANIARAVFPLGTPRAWEGCWPESFQRITVSEEGTCICRRILVRVRAASAPV